MNRRFRYTELGSAQCDARIAAQVEGKLDAIQNTLNGNTRHLSGLVIEEAIGFKNPAQIQREEAAHQDFYADQAAAVADETTKSSLRVANEYSDVNVSAIGLFVGSKLVGRLARNRAEVYDQVYFGQAEGALGSHYDLGAIDRFRAGWRRVRQGVPAPSKRLAYFERTAEGIDPEVIYGDQAELAFLNDYLEGEDKINSTYISPITVVAGAVKYSVQAALERERLVFGEAIEDLSALYGNVKRND